MQLRNRAGWLFEDAHNSYVIALLVFHKSLAEDLSVSLSPGTDRLTEFASARSAAPLVWAIQHVKDAISEDLRLPLLTRKGEETIVERLLSYPRIAHDDAGRFKAIPYAVVDVGKDIRSIGLDPRGIELTRSRVISSFAFAADARARKVSSSGLDRFLQNKIEGATWRGALESDLVINPLRLLSLVYRYPSRNDDSRTLIGTILPENVCPAVGYVHALVTPHATVLERLVLIGLVNSFVWDWIARRFVDRHVTAGVFSLLPSPSHATMEELSQIAALSASLLSDSPQAENIHDLRAFSFRRVHGTTDELGAQLDAAIATLYSISLDEAVLMMKDFTETGLSPQRRDRICQLLRN